MPAPRRTLIGQMLPAQLHRQFGHPFHRRFLRRFSAHPVTDAPEINGFYKANRKLQLLQPDFFRLMWTAGLS